MNKDSVVSGYDECHTSVNGNTTTTKIIIRFGIKAVVFNLEPQTRNQQSIIDDYETYLKQQIAKFISRKWGLTNTDYYLDIQSKSKNTDFLVIEIKPRIIGGGVVDAFFRVVWNGITAIFKPIIKPLIGIANAFLMLLKAIVYIIMLFTWFLKFLTWIFMEVLPSIPTDIFGLVRFLSYMLIDAVFGTFMYYFKKLFNSAGSTVIGATLSGWDNNPDESQPSQNPARYSTDEFNEINSEAQNSQPGMADKIDCSGRKCYRTEAGTVPWTVILATVLFPPSGVFMELGLSGWLQILVCLLLTFMFYFPGLIYALIILYC